MSAARLVTTLMRQVEELRDENEELRQLAFGEIEYFEALAARWAKHLHPRDHRGRPCRTR